MEFQINQNKFGETVYKINPMIEVAENKCIISEIKPNKITVKWPSDQVPLGLQTINDDIYNNLFKLQPKLQDYKNRFGLTFKRDMGKYTFSTGVITKYTKYYDNDENKINISELKVGDLINLVVNVSNITELPKKNTISPTVFVKYIVKN